MEHVESQWNFHIKRHCEKERYQVIAKKLSDGDIILSIISSNIIFQKFVELLFTIFI